MVDSPLAECRRRLQDGISRIQKVAAVELGFHGAPGCFWGTWIYIGGAHERGGRTLLPRGFLVCCLTSTPSLLDCVCSKKITPKGFIRLDSF